MSEAKPIDDGGPAFPNQESSQSINFPGHRDVYASHGMSLRDWFAEMALVGMSASGDPQVQKSGPAVRAAWAYVEADAMIEERKKPPQT